MVQLSVNVNKVATLRNSRGGAEPRVLRAVEVCLEAGARSITVHHRADERHIRRGDVLEIAALLATVRTDPRGVPEFNIEGDPRPDLIDLVVEVCPTQCTLVPVAPGEITSQAGWPPSTDRAGPGGVVRQLQREGIRVSLFVDPDEAAVRWAADLGADRVELYTEPFARAFERGEGLASLQRYAGAAELAHTLGLGVNAGHDLDLQNLPTFRELPHLDEVSIGHALISHALWVGLRPSVRDFLDVLAGGAMPLSEGPLRAV
jgi:pyridoxine 5-phosphate synthase